MFRKILISTVAVLAVLAVIGAVSGGGKKAAAGHAAPAAPAVTAPAKHHHHKAAPVRVSASLAADVMGSAKIHALCHLRSVALAAGYPDAAVEAKFAGGYRRGVAGQRNVPTARAMYAEIVSRCS